MSQRLTYSQVLAAHPGTILSPLTDKDEMMSRETDWLIVGRVVTLCPDTVLEKVNGYDGDPVEGLDSSRSFSGCLRLILIPANPITPENPC